MVELTQSSSKAEAHKSNDMLKQGVALAKDIIFWIYLYCGYVALRDFILGRLGQARAVVLCYHRIGGCDVLTKPADEFQRDLNYLKKHYECIGLAELCERLRNNKPLKQRIAVITFDDGYRDNFTQAVPALKAAGIPATFFVSTGFMSTDRIFPHDIELAEKSEPGSYTIEHPKLTWDDLRAMQNAGFEIGAHTVNHADLGKADRPTTERELYDSLAALNRELGERPRAFAFPFGKPENITKQSLEIIQQAGYYAAVFAYGGANTRGSNRFGIQRFDAGNGYLSRLALRARIAGFDPDYLRRKLKKEI